MELTPSREWLRSKADKARDDQIAHKMAKLKHPWRTAILDFLRSRNDREPPHLIWKLCFIGLPRRVSRLALFGHRRGDCLVRLVLCRTKVAENDSNNLPPWENPRLGIRGDSASIDPPANISSKTNTENRAQRLKGALRLPSDALGKNSRQQAKAESRGVSFAINGESDEELDECGTIRIEMEIFGDDEQRGTTTIDESLFPSEALSEFGLPWRKLEKEIDGETKELVQIPQALSDDQIEQLRRITMTKIIEGEGKACLVSGLYDFDSNFV